MDLKTRCAYTTITGTTCTVKKLHEGSTLCKRHWLMPKGREQVGLPPITEEEKARNANASVGGDLFDDELGSDSESGSEGEDEMVDDLKSGGERKKKKPVRVRYVDDEEPKSKSKKEVKKEPKSTPKEPAEAKPKKKKEGDAFAEAMDDLDKLDGKVPSGEADIDKIFDNAVDGVADDEEEEDDDECPTADPISKKIVVMGYTTLLGLLETFCAPHLQGIQKEIMEEDGVDEALEQIAIEHEETLGIKDADGITKLLLLTGAMCSRKYMVSKLQGAKPMTMGSQPVQNEAPVTAPSNIYVPPEFRDL